MPVSALAVISLHFGSENRCFETIFVKVLKDVSVPAPNSEVFLKQNCHLPPPVGFRHVNVRGERGKECRGGSV